MLHVLCTEGTHSSQFTATPRVLVTPNVPKPRKPSNAQRVRAEVNTAAAATVAAPAAPSTPPRTTSALPYTPFKIAASGKKAREGDATPKTKSLLKAANQIFKVYVAVQNAFPTESDTLNEARASFKTACTDLGLSCRSLRSEQDRLYAEYVLAVVCSSLCC